jgi:hypothetical protein
LRIDWTADPEAQIGIDPNGWLGADNLTGWLVHLTIDDEPEGTVFSRVIAQQHDGPGEIRIRHLGHREEEKRGGAGHISILLLAPAFGL